MKTPTRTSKTDRTFSAVRRHAWILSVLIGAGGLLVPRLGLLVPLIMVALLGTSLFRGRYWCGNVCPHGSFFDRIIMPLGPERPIPGFLRSRGVAAGVLLFFLVNTVRRAAALFSVLGAGSAPLADRAGALFAGIYLVVLLAGGLLGLVLHSRTWCQFCPMGTMAGILHRLGKKTRLAAGRDRVLTLSDPGRCRQCGQCARVCPMQLEPWQNHSPDRGFTNPRCIRCDTCVRHCPLGLLSLARVPRPRTETP